MNGYFIEREREIDLMLTALISGVSMTMLGGVGEAKSMLVRSLTSHIRGAECFDWLLTKFTTPEELFGAPDFRKLKTEGKIVRNTEHMLPTAQIAFIDEIFKANSAILNTLLTIMNEKIFYNGGKYQDVPLIALYSASNELPEDESLKALYDRLLIRKITEPIKDINNWKVLANLSDKYRPNTIIESAELPLYHAEAMNIPIDTALEDMIKIRLALKNKGILFSDRRFKKSIAVLKAYAYVQGHKGIRKEDLSVLQYIYWDEPEEYNIVQSVVLQFASPLTAKVVKYIPILKEFEDKIKGKTELDSEAVEIYKKVAKIVDEINSIKTAAESNNTDTTDIVQVLHQAEQVKSTISKDILKIY